MRYLVIWADTSSSNIGVRALAAGIRAIVEDVDDEAEVVFQSFGPGPAPIQFTRNRLAAELLPRRILSDWIRQFDLIIDTRAGDSFTSIYGWDRYLAMNMMTLLASRANVPVVMSPQTIGPFRSRTSRWVAKWALSKANMVMSRDELSARVASQLYSGDIIRGTDVVFAIPRMSLPDATSQRRCVINVSGLLWHKNEHVDHIYYRELLNELISNLVAADANVELLCHVLPSADPDDDLTACQALSSGQSSSQLSVFVPESLDDVREYISQSGVIVASRMHACLNALSLGVPSVALAYSKKFEPLFRDLGWDGVVDLREKPSVSEVLTTLGRVRAMSTNAVTDSADEKLGVVKTAFARCVGGSDA